MFPGRIYRLTVSPIPQIDCEMSFVEQEDVLEVFEGLISHLFKEVRGVDIPKLEK